MATLDTAFSMPLTSEKQNNNILSSYVPLRNSYVGIGKNTNLKNSFYNIEKNG